MYFDDFKVTYTKSPVVQMDEYYPFGLAFNSYSRENGISQDFKYNGKENQDELGLGWLDYGARMYMGEIARWGVVDPLSEKNTWASGSVEGNAAVVRRISPCATSSAGSWV